MYIEYVHMRPRSENLLNGLAKALNFGAPELLANRRGQLHSSQLTRFISDFLMAPILGLVLSALTPIFFRYIWAAVVELRPLDKFTASLLAHPSSFLMQMRFGIEEPFPLIIELGYMIFPLVAIHYLMKIRWPIAIDILSRKVKKDSGPVCVRWDEKRLRGKQGREGDLVSRYSYFVNGHEYRISRAAYEALVPQLEYNLYYLPLSRMIVSAEPLDLSARKVQTGTFGLQITK
ncbi:MAG TPA: hypothetical protein VGL53_25440 [Bryobacteraceae bacterium]